MKYIFKMRESRFVISFANAGCTVSASGELLVSVPVTSGIFVFYSLSVPKQLGETKSAVGGSFPLTTLFFIPYKLGVLTN